MWKTARIEQNTAGARGGLRNQGMSIQPLVQARGDIETRLQRSHYVGDRLLRHHATGVGDSNHHGIRARRLSGREAHVRQVQTRRPAGGAPELSETPLRTPESEAARRLDRQLVMGIAQVQQVWRTQVGAGEEVELLAGESETVIGYGVAASGSVEYRARR